LALSLLVPLADADIFITSAKSGQHVAALHLLFQNLAQKLLKQHIERGGDQAAGLSAAGPPVQRIHSSLPPLANGGEKKKGECCS
jgi:hypothetical protein